MWVSNLRSYSGNGMEGVVCQRAEMCSVWRVSGFDGAYELVWVGMGWYGQVWAVCPKSAAASTVIPRQSAAGIPLRHAAAFTADRSARTHKEAVRSAKPTPQRRFDTNSLLKRRRCTAQRS